MRWTCAALALTFASASALAQSGGGRVSPASALTMGETFTIRSKALRRLFKPGATK